MTQPTPRPFLPGRTLPRVRYEEAVRPLLDARTTWGCRTPPHAAARRRTPPHAAARVGPGSAVLGFDTARSADHEWGPRLEPFLTPKDAAERGADIEGLFSHRLPREVRGWPTPSRRRPTRPTRSA